MSAATKPNALGEATRQRIMLAAERLFAEHGIGAASLREVAETAGQRNKVAIQYHFGDRDGLLLAIFQYRSAATQELRGVMVADLLRRASPLEMIAGAVSAPVSVRQSDRV